MSSKISFLVVDDQVVIREGIEAIVSSNPKYKVVGKASNGQEAIQEATGLNPDFVLMDSKMPILDGAQCIREIRKENTNTRILGFAPRAREEWVVEALDAGANGCLLKNFTRQELLMAIEVVLTGEIFLSPSLVSIVVGRLKDPTDKLDRFENISHREEEVLRLIAKGHSNQEIADLLFISPRTVEVHVSAILAKLRVKNRTQAALFALENGN